MELELDPDQELERLRYPIGRFRARTGLSAAERRALIDEIAAVPVELGEAVAKLTPRQLDTPYRPDGWTVRQVVHHLPDSHLNAYVRFKLAVTEDEPRIKAYDEAAWAELGLVTLEANLQLYAWHGRHHLAHVTRLRERMGW